MKIYHNEASVLVSKIIHTNKNDIKKLSQKDREICLKAIKCLSDSHNKGMNITLPSQLNYDQTVEKIKHALLAKKDFKKSFIPVYIFSVPQRIMSVVKSIFKGILNLLHLRISSTKLNKDIQMVKKPFFNKHCDQYLKDYCNVSANCDLNQAKVFFLGDVHSDPIQELVRKNLISHYSLNGNQNENLVLVEGLDIDAFPSNLDEKKFVRESWEVKKHFEKHGKFIDMHCKIMKEFKEELDKLELEKNKIKTQNKGLGKLKLEKGKTNFQLLIEACENIASKCDFIHKKSEKMKVIRNNDLIAKVKGQSSKQFKKIFVIAGNNHLQEKDYNVMNSFKDVPCAMIIPKLSEIGENNTKKVVSNMIKLGTYDAAYADLGEQI